MPADAGLDRRCGDAFMVARDGLGAGDSEYFGMSNVEKFKSALVSVMPKICFIAVDLCKEPATVKVGCVWHGATQYASKTYVNCLASSMLRFTDGPSNGAGVCEEAYGYGVPAAFFAVLCIFFATPGVCPRSSRVLASVLRFAS